MAEPKFNDEAVKAIWEEIKTNGMYGRSKNDFYDFVLYTLNRHDPKHFLDGNDNAKYNKNAVWLKHGEIVTCLLCPVPCLLYALRSGRGKPKTMPPGSALRGCFCGAGMCESAWQ